MEKGYNKDGYRMCKKCPECGCGSLRCYTSNMKQMIVKDWICLSLKCHYKKREIIRKDDVN